MRGRVAIVIGVLVGHTERIGPRNQIINARQCEVIGMGRSDISEVLPVIGGPVGGHSLGARYRQRGTTVDAAGIERVRLNSGRCKGIARYRSQCGTLIECQITNRCDTTADFQSL